MIRNSFICKLINVQASMKENKEKKIKNCDEISKLIKEENQSFLAALNLNQNDFKMNLMQLPHE